MDKLPSFDASEAPRRSTSSLDADVTLGSRLRNPGRNGCSGRRRYSPSRFVLASIIDEWSMADSGLVRPSSGDCPNAARVHRGSTPISTNGSRKAIWACGSRIALGLSLDSTRSGMAGLASLDGRMGNDHILRRDGTNSTLGDATQCLYACSKLVRLSGVLLRHERRAN